MYVNGNAMITSTRFGQNVTTGDGGVGGALHARSALSVDGSKFIDNNTEDERAAGGALASFTSAEISNSAFTELAQPA